MPDAVRQLIDLMEARPFESMAALMATYLYVRLMTSGPRPH
jgi:hypothetical protein